MDIRFLNTITGSHLEAKEVDGLMLHKDHVPPVHSIINEKWQVVAVHYSWGVVNVGLTEII